ncbi:unnamed protein product [Albugo candida]|uniref:Uncharacterized protein n=1 Tax=Albugo candida TaxID=65357 RepID=A0A024FW85_9STRA|nr:unnamed protein product [Albugo candida]|eukprot:CCI10914.1 unnamed protein product [Albugo candida]
MRSLEPRDCEKMNCTLPMRAHGSKKKMTRTFKGNNMDQRQQRTCPEIYVAKVLFYKGMNNTTSKMCEISLMESDDQRLFYHAHIEHHRAQLYRQSHQHELALVELIRYIKVKRSSMEKLSKSSITLKCS